MDAYIAQRSAWNKKYAGVIAALNPPEAFIKAGHKRGMKVIIWLDIFDDGYPGYRSKFLAENPHCQWTAKDGKTKSQIQDIMILTHQMQSNYEN